MPFIMNLFFFSSQTLRAVEGLSLVHTLPGFGLPFPSVQTRHQPLMVAEDNAALFPVVNLETLPLLGSGIAPHRVAYPDNLKLGGRRSREECRVPWFLLGRNISSRDHVT